MKIWDERSIYDKPSIKGFRQALHPNEKAEGVKENNNSNNKNNHNNEANGGKDSLANSKRKREND